MKLATVRLLHCMQGLEKSRKTLIFEKKRRKALFFVLTALLKLQIPQKTHYSSK